MLDAALAAVEREQAASVRRLARPRRGAALTTGAAAGHPSGGGTARRPALLRQRHRDPGPARAAGRVGPVVLAVGGGGHGVLVGSYRGGDGDVAHVDAVPA